jgi:hypothetical protein
MHSHAANSLQTKECNVNWMQEAILKEYLLCSIGGPKESENTNFKAVDDYAQ